MNWTPKKGYEGSIDDRALLEAFGWKLIVDANGFAYWIGPGGAGVVSLYADGTWAGGAAQFHTLDEYLHWYAAHHPHLARQPAEMEKSA